MDVEVSVSCGPLTGWDLKPGSPEMLAFLRELERKEDWEDLHRLLTEMQHRLGLAQAVRPMLAAVLQSWIDRAASERKRNESKS